MNQTAQYRGSVSHQLVANQSQHLQAGFVSRFPTANLDNLNGVMIPTVTSHQEHIHYQIVPPVTNSRNKIMVDVSTMTDPEEDEQNGTNWQNVNVPSNTKVAEYLSSLRQFLKLSTPDEKKKKRQLGDVKIMTSADGTRLFCCPECHVAYPDKSLLEPHLAGHKIERRWLCGVCGAGLKRKDHLDRHQLCHTDERPFVCHACPKAFKRNEHLTQHYMTHSGEKAQVCTDCGKAFYRRDHLRKHLRKHMSACTTYPPPPQPSLTS